MEGGSAWAIKPGTVDWADEVEAEEVKRGPVVDEEAFPSLGEAIKAPQLKGKAKKGKGTKMGLNDFLSVQAGRKGAASDADLLMQLPKGSSGLPREERDANALGGGFRDYGGDRQGGFRRGDRGDREEREPSRADAAADWGAERKFTPTDSSDRSRGFGGGGFGERRGGFGDRDRDGGDRGGFGERPRREERPASEADLVDDWGANRKFTPGAGSDSRSFGSGFGKDRDRPTRSGFPDSGDSSRADAGDWGARRGPPAEPSGPSSSGRRGYGFSEQPVSQADMEDRWSHRAAAAAAEPSGRPAEQPASERPRLKLAPRTKPLESPVGANGVAPSSPAAAAASPSSSGQQQTPARKSNPFGEAKPREEVLKEKGIDYRKEEMKLDHGEVIRDKDPDELELEQEVDELRVRLEGLKELTPEETDTIDELAQELDDKEKTLYKMQAELDDRVRFSKNRPERERSEDAAARTAAADDGTGFQEVRNPRKERAAGAAAGSPVAEGRDADGGRGDGAWGSGRGFRDREGSRGGRGGSLRDSRESREGPRGGVAGDRDREGRDRRPAGGPSGRAAGGW